MMKPLNLFPYHASRTFMRSTVLLCAALSLPVLLLPIGCKKAEEEPTPEVNVQAAHPQQGSISEQIAADAILTPLAQAAISPKVSAPVKQFYVQRGSRVHAGELLATLENSDLTAAALDNKGSYTAAQATFETATKATAPEDMTKARLDLAQAKANLDLAQSIVTARSQLLKRSDSRTRPGHGAGHTGATEGRIRHRSTALRLDAGCQQQSGPGKCPGQSRLRQRKVSWIQGHHLLFKKK